MNHILKDLRIIEGSAFVAAPLAGMTLAQLGADVIRFDPIRGGLDERRWPVDQHGKSLYWVGLNKGKRSIAVDTRKPEGQELVAQDRRGRPLARRGPDRGVEQSRLLGRRHRVRFHRLAGLCRDEPKGPTQQAAPRSAP